MPPITRQSTISLKFRIQLTLPLEDQIIRDLRVLPSRVTGGTYMHFSSLQLYKKADLTNLQTGTPEWSSMISVVRENPASPGNSLFRYLSSMM